MCKKLENQILVKFASQACMNGNAFAKNHLSKGRSSVEKIIKKTIPK